ncbi:hypothetical protein BD779DRAFT_333870 [Infundibulicybe gibba]|nr:hypothetical protein BD779DRAFT_333870 [Infundibulicybe gibba]
MPSFQALGLSDSRMDRRLAFLVRESTSRGLALIDNSTWTLKRRKSRVILVPSAGPSRNLPRFLISGCGRVWGRCMGVSAPRTYESWGALRLGYRLTLMYAGVNGLASSNNRYDEDGNVQVGLGETRELPLREARPVVRLSCWKSEVHEVCR